MRESRWPPSFTRALKRNLRGSLFLFYLWMNPVIRLISCPQSLPANPCLSLIPNPIITNSSKYTTHPNIQLIQIYNSSKYTTHPNIQYFQIYNTSNIYSFSSLYGYIYKIKLYICLKITHDIGVCGH